MDWIGGKAAAKLLGMPKAGFYRRLKDLRVEKRIGGDAQIWVVEQWGGIKYKGQNWIFSKKKITGWLDDLF